MADAPPEKTEPTVEESADASLKQMREVWTSERTTLFQRAVLMALAAIIRILREGKK